MSQKHPIDELFRQKLENHAFKPPMELWEKIDQQRNRRKILLRRGFSMRFLLLSGLILSLAVAGWFTWDYLHKQNVEPAEDTASTAVKFNAPDNSTRITQQTIKQIQSAETDTPAKEAGGNISAEEPTAPITNSVDAFSEVALNNSQAVSGLEQSSNQTNKQETIKTAARDVAFEDEQTISVPPALNAEGVESGIIASSEKKVDEEISFDFSKTSEMTLSVDRLPLSSKLLSKEERGSADFPVKETDCPTFAGLPGGIYMDMNASIDLAQRTMTVRDPEMDAYLLEREKSEIPYFAFSAGMHLTALSERGFALKSGVDYSQINESFNFDGGEVEIITILPGGDTTWEVKNLRIRATNRYQMVDIPLLAGYEHNFSNFSLSVYGGGLLNVKFAKKGNIVSNETMQPVGVTTGEPEKFERLFRERLGFGWYTSFGFAYKLEHGTQIRVEPYFRFYPKSFSAADNVIDQRYFLTGIKVGVRKRL